MSSRVGRWAAATSCATAMALAASCSSGGDVAGGVSTTTSAADGVALIDEPPSPATDDDVGGLRFVDVTEAAGLASPHSDSELFDDASMTSGAAVADVDGDGDDDLYVTRVGLPNALYLNEGDGTFTDVAPQLGIDRADAEGSSAAAFADVDGDGDLDLYVTGAGRSGNVLYVNNGVGGFVDETEARGLALSPLDESANASRMFGATFGDLNGDGSTDLITTHWRGELLKSAAISEFDEEAGAAGAIGAVCETVGRWRDAGAELDADVSPLRSAVYFNDGSGHFDDATEASGIDMDAVLSFTPVLADADDDADLDLFLTGDACTSALYLNDGTGRFDDVTAASGLGTDENGMGSVVRDIDGDGLIDWFVTAIGYPTESGRCPFQIGLTGCGGNRLYLNNGDTTFRDATDEFGVRNGWWGWGAAVEDFSNDGSPDIVMTNGYRSIPLDEAAGAPKGAAEFLGAFADDASRFWVRHGETFADAADIVGLDDTSVGHALIPFDYDTDGDLDLFIASSTTPPVLYRNDSPARNGWLTVRLDDTTRPTDRGATGAKVTVRGAIDAPEPLAVGWITSAGSYESQKPAEFHVGLGEGGPDAVSIEVRWPDGHTQIVDDVPTDQRVTITYA